MDLNGRTALRGQVAAQLLFEEGWDGAMPLYEGFVMQHTSDGIGEEFQLPGQLPAAREFSGERQIQNAEAYTRYIKNREYELTIGIKRLHWISDKIGVYRSQIANLGAVMREQPDELFADLLVGGFTETGFDDVAFFSDDHPAGDGTASNLVSGALDADTFEEGYAKLEGMVGPRGRPMRPMRRRNVKAKLIVGPDNRAGAERIVKMQYDDAGASNPNYGKAEVEVFEYLTGAYANYWFLGLSGHPMGAFIHQLREAAHVEILDDVKGENIWRRNQIEIGAMGTWAMDYGIPHMMIGSTGS